MYIIQEMQTTGGVTSLLEAETRTDHNEAESVFYLKVSYAATSTVEVHTVVLYDEHGNQLLRKFYEHFPEPVGEQQTKT